MLFLSWIVALFIPSPNHPAVNAAVFAIAGSLFLGLTLDVATDLLKRFRPRSRRRPMLQFYGNLLLLTAILALVAGMIFATWFR